MLTNPFDLESIASILALVEERRDFANPPTASILIVAYNTQRELLACLDSLKKQSFRDFEIILIDNGKNETIYQELKNYSLLYLRLDKNYKPSTARNVGILFSRGEIICFLDDDALAHQNYVEQHICAHQKEGVLGVRGKVLPKTRRIYNYLAPHYDRGQDSFPCFIDLEGNSSFKKDILLKVKGFNPDIFAHEGIELSYRILKLVNDQKSLVYYPDAIIYHDFSTNLRKLIQKTLRGERMRIILERQYPELNEFIQSYHPLPDGGYPKPSQFWQRIQVGLLRRFLSFLRKQSKHLYLMKFT